MVSPRVRLVLFDVFDTLCTPRIPIHEQYAEEAVRLGFTVTPQSVRAAFKPAYKELNAIHPLYGKHSNPPLTPEAWWTSLIRRCMAHAGASEASLAARGDELASALLSRFESDKGYRAFSDTLSTLKGLQPLVKTSVVSNADPRILRTLDALGITPLLSYPPTLSWDVESAKPDRRIYEAACAACEEQMGEGVVMVGDELAADFRGAVNAGIEGRLLRRVGEWSDGAVREAEEELGDVNVVRTLTEVLEEVKRRNS